MRVAVFVLVLCFAAVAGAQMQPGPQSPGGSGQPGSTQGGPPPSSTPATFPDTKAKPTKDAKSPEEEAQSRHKTEREIEKTIRSDARLHGAEVKATVNQKNVVVSGTVRDEAQRKLALHMAEAYASGREIIDKLVVAGKT